MHTYVNYVQVGIIGLVEWEWLVTLATLEPEDVIYTDFVKAAKRLVPELKDEVWSIGEACVYKCTCTCLNCYDIV